MSNQRGRAIALATGLLLTTSLACSARPQTHCISMRPTPGATGFQNAVPIFSVKDVDVSLRYFVNVLGFKRDWYYRERDEGPTIYASVSRGGATIHLERHHVHEGEEDHQHAVVSYFYVEGIDALHDEWAAKQADILYDPHATTKGPVDEPWGMREVVVRDPDGNVMRVGELLRRN